MKFRLIFFTILLVFNYLLGQDRRIVASAGRDLTTSTYLMTFTVGEPIIYGGYNSNYQLSNGFIQPYPNSSINSMYPELKVYPNPFGTFIMLNGSAESDDQVRVQIIDLNGKLILEEELIPHYYKLEIPQHCPPGNYLLNFYTLPGQFIQQMRMIKMNSEINK
jgi:hypothetical protein